MAMFGGHLREEYAQISRPLRNSSLATPTFSPSDPSSYRLLYLDDLGAEDPKRSLWTEVVGGRRKGGRLVEVDVDLDDRDEGEVGVHIRLI